MKKHELTHESFQHLVSERIRKARWRAGLTQESAAEEAGLCYRYLADIERCRRNISLRTLLSLSIALKVSVADLVAVDSKRIDLDSLILHPPEKAQEVSEMRQIIFGGQNTAFKRSP